MSIGSERTPSSKVTGIQLQTVGEPVTQAEPVMQQVPQGEAASEAEPEDPSRWPAVLQAVVGIAVWVSLGAWFLQVLNSNDVDVLLAVKSSSVLEVSGEVLHRGQDVAGGRVQLTVDNPKLSEHRASEVVAVKNGTFTARYPLSTGPDGKPEALRVSARFFGKHDTTPLYGQAVAYTNCSSPIHVETLIKVFFAIAALAILMIMLFTGDLTKETAKFLFGATYLTCFLSVTAPLALLLVVSENRYLIDLMRSSPVGLVQAKVTGIEQNQWFLNVGGVVREAEPPATKPSVVEQAPVATPLPLPLDTTSVVLLEPQPPKIEQSVVPVVVEKDEPLKEPRKPSYQLEGGLAIPFYVIILAVLGAGISMMRSVPDIQKKHIADLPSTGGNPFIAVFMMFVAPFWRAKIKDLGTEGQHAGCDVRKKVIDQYMYLLSAPFLAVAVYYLLQIIASNVTEPVLVLMAFSAGLISERIVTSIVELANRTLGGDSDNPANARREPSSNDAEGSANA